MRLVRQAILSDWPDRDRATVIGSSLAIFAGFLLNSTWSVVTLPIQQSFSAGVDGEVLLRQLPDIAGLLAVPVAGALGGRVTAARVASLTAVLLLVGALLMVAAPSLAWVVVGAGITSIGRAMIGVFALATVASVVVDDSRRTTGFAILGAMGPIAYIVGPVLAGMLVNAGGWRLVGVVWLVSACVAAVAARMLRDPSAEPSTSGHKEPWTPILAGLTLVSIVQMMSAIALHGIGSVAAIGWMLATALPTTIWLVLARRLANPSFGGRTLRVPGLAAVLVVAMLAQCGELWFYVAVLARFAHRLSSLEVSLALLAAQCASLGGAFVARWLVRSIGLRRSGTALLAVFAATMFLSCAQSRDLPLSVTIAILSVSAVAELGVGVCISQAVMSCAPKGLDRQVSAYRSAATGVGNALAVLLVAAMVGSTMGESTRRRAEANGASPETIEALVRAVRENVPSSVVAHELHMSPERLARIRDERRDVMVDGFRTHGLVSGVVLAIAAIGFWLVRRDPPAPTAAA